VRRPGRSAVYLAFFALLLLLLALPRATPRAADSPGSLIPLEVQDQALREGSGRVILELRLPGGPHVPEGLFSAAGAGAQQSDIAAVHTESSPASRARVTVYCVSTGPSHSWPWR